MLNDVQSRKIARYRKLASKNKFCKYLAVVLLIWSLFWSKFLSFHKRRLVILTELCLVVAIFAFSTSFAPHFFSTNDDSAETAVINDISDTVSAQIVSNDSEPVDEHDLVDPTKDTANLEDLIDKLDYYLVHDDVRAQIAINGYTKVKNMHTWQHRIAELLKIIVSNS